MKKIVYSLILLILPVFISAGSVENLFIDSTVKQNGDLEVKEIVNFNSVNDPFNIYYQNRLDDNSLYETNGINLTYVGVLDNITSINLFYQDTNFTQNHVSDYKSYEVNDDGKYLAIKFNETGTYYLEYTVSNVSILHEDASEFYYKFLYNLNYDINEGAILTRFSSKSELFKVYAHGNKKKFNVKSDPVKRVVLAEIANITKEDDFDLRVLYDSNLLKRDTNDTKSDFNKVISKINLDESPLTRVFLTLFAAIGIIAVITLIFDAFSRFRLQIESFTMKDKKIDKNMKLMFLSDIHDRDINEKILNIVANEKPDAIIIGGDAVNGNYSNEDDFINKTENIINLMKMLKGNKVYYVFGNHEFLLTNEELRKYKRKIQETDTILLNNKYVDLSKNVRLSGFVCSPEYYNTKKVYYNKDYINKTVGELDKKKYNVLVAHNPLCPNKYEEYGSDLVLSGHVHGGVVRMPFALLSPENKFFPRYSNGLYTFNSMKMIVSRGIGYSDVIPVRVCNRGHIVIVNLEKE